MILSTQLKISTYSSCTALDGEKNGISSAF